MKRRGFLRTVVGLLLAPLGIRVKTWDDPYVLHRSRRAVFPPKHPDLWRGLVWVWDPLNGSTTYLDGKPVQSTDS